MNMIETLTPANTPTPIGPYNHIAKVGSLITIGGTAGFDPATGQLAGPDVYSQTTQILTSFRTMLAAVDSDLEHVLHVNVFLGQMADFEEMNRAYVALMGNHRPARTVIGVHELPKPGVLLTMNLTAVTRGAASLSPDAGRANINQAQTIRLLNPADSHRPVGYSHVGEVLAGRPIFISGQVAIDPAGNLVGPDDLSTQTEQVFRNLARALAAVGATFDDVVKFTYFMLDIGQIPVVRAVRDRYINTANPPASSAVEVRRLYRADVLIEVEAVAVVR